MFMYAADRGFVFPSNSSLLADVCKKSKEEKNNVEKKDKSNIYYK